MSLFLPVLLFQLISSASFLPGDALAGEEPVVDPSRVTQGGVALVRWMPAPPRSDVPEIVCLGRRVPMVPEGGGWVGILGVDLEDAAGHRECDVQSGGKTRRFAFEVAKGEFPEERLTLPKDMVTPPAEVLRRIRAEARRLSMLWPRTGEGMWDRSFAMPMEATVITPFGVRRILNDIPKSPHKGLDLRGAAGTPVHSMNRGRIALVDDQYYGGNTIVVDHGAGIFSYYMHLSETSVVEGQEVARGQLIGRVGSSGRATGPHLHFGVKIAGANVDPLALVNIELGGGDL